MADHGQRLLLLRAPDLLRPRRLNVRRLGIQKQQRRQPPAEWLPPTPNAPQPSRPGLWTVRSGPDGGPLALLTADPTRPERLQLAALARVVGVFGAAHPHHAYAFANRQANRTTVLMHDGVGVSLAARKLNAGQVISPADGAGTHSLSRTQFDALVLGLPWHRIGDAGVMRML